MRVLSGSWELCEHRNLEGWCHVFNVDEDDLRDLSFNDKASSLRYVEATTEGITVFQ